MSNNGAPTAFAGADWRASAACRDTDPELFFPVGTPGRVLTQVDQAKQICRDCPVRVDCLSWALRHSLAFGIWGGTTEEERQSVRRMLIQQRIHREQGAASRPSPRGRA
jgi:WhiB family redox-sensing transcriptional regulator